jgi:hypothetical protein
MRLLIAPLLVMALGGVVACGEEKTVSDGDIVQALDLKPDNERPVYAIGGDAFCEVDQDLLNDSTEVDEAKSEKNASGLVITDSAQSIGVVAVPPFDPSCERDARRALERIGEG